MPCCDCLGFFFWLLFHLDCYFLFFTECHLTSSFCWKALEVVCDRLVMGYFMLCHPLSNLCSPQMLTSSGFSITETIFGLLETYVKIGFNNLPLLLCEPFLLSKWKAQSHWCPDNLMSSWTASRDLGAGGRCCCRTILAVQSNNVLLLSSPLTRTILLI